MENNYIHLLDYPAGALTVRVVTGTAGGNETLNLLTGTTGIEDIILAAWGYHDDTGVARAIQWRFYDAINTTTAMSESCSVLDYVKLSMYSISNVAGREEVAFLIPFKADNQRCPQLVVPALTAGKKGYIHAIVLRRYGQAG